MGHALVLGGLGLVASVAGAVAMWDFGPNWYPLALVALALPEPGRVESCGSCSWELAALRIGFTGMSRTPRVLRLPHESANRAQNRRELDMKFMLMMHAPRGKGDWPIHDLAAGGPQGAHRVHASASTRSSREAGELVGAEGLAGAGPGQGGASREGRRARVTDGPFPEAKEFLAGYWIVDVESAEARLSRSPPRVGGARARAARR